MRVSLLDYGAGNVRSLINALEKLGFEIDFITSPEQIATAQVLLFPGVGSFGQCMKVLREKNYEEALRQYVKADRPFLGICLGMQSLFASSEESPGVKGLCVIDCPVQRFTTTELAVPQIGTSANPNPNPSQTAEHQLPLTVTLTLTLTLTRLERRDAAQAERDVRLVLRGER